MKPANGASVQSDEHERNALHALNAAALPTPIPIDRHC